MNCIVVDDEPLARQGMEMHIASVTALNLVGSFSNALAAGDFLRNCEVDIMFLDINMPEISGLEFLKTLRNSPLVIFTTAYPQYALESYELDALDYLVKPIRIERFLKAVNKAESHLNLMRKELLRNEIEAFEEEFIFIKADRKFFKIFFRNILYIEGLKDYVVIYSQDSKIITSMNVKAISAQLPAKYFARVSKSYIVNVSHITSFDSELVYINKVEIPLGQIYKDEFLRQYVDGKVAKR
jgi:DNA-binding LytR/AlgR family response regulator